MITTTITIDEKGYYGEDATRTYESFFGQERDHLRIEDGPGRPIEGYRCLQTELEKIIRYMRDGEIAPHTIQLTIVQ